MDTEHDYYNTGALLIDLAKARKLMEPDAIYAYVQQYTEELLLSDQDVFNALYSEKTVQIDDWFRNYDVRYFYSFFYYNPFRWVLLGGS